MKNRIARLAAALTIAATALTGISLVTGDAPAYTPQQDTTWGADSPQDTTWTAPADTTW